MQTKLTKFFSLLNLFIMIHIAGSGQVQNTSNNLNQSVVGKSALYKLVDKTAKSMQFKRYTPLTFSRFEANHPVAENCIEYKIDPFFLDDVLINVPEAISVTLPLGNDKSMQLELVKFFIGGDSLNVKIKSENGERKIKLFGGYHYRGIIKDEENSFVVLNVHENYFNATVAIGQDNFTLTQNKQNLSEYIFYNEADRHNSIAPNCLGTADDISETVAMKYGNELTNSTDASCNVVKCYFECDYKMYNDFGSDNNAIISFLTDAFANSATLYYNIESTIGLDVHSVFIEISEMAIWESPDFLETIANYSGPGNSVLAYEPALSYVMANTGSHFDGNVAYFLTTRDDIHPGLDIGLSYKINSISNKYLSHILIGLGDLSVNNFPTFTWSSFLIAHELGHVLGSYHTTLPRWKCGLCAIDNCSTTSCGQPLDFGSGSIMTTPDCPTFPDFTVGFGPEIACIPTQGYLTYPGKAIYDNVIQSTNLSGSSAFIPTNLKYDNDELSWVFDIGSDYYTLQYRLLCNDGCSYQGKWITVNNIFKKSIELVQIGTMVPGSRYEFRVSAGCSPYSDSYQFQIPLEIGSEPQVLQTYDITAHSATLNWSGLDGVHTYEVEVEALCPGCANMNFIVSENYLRLHELNVDPYDYSIDYSWKVRDINSPYWSLQENFTTLTDIDEDDCLINYTAVSGSPLQNYFISSVKWNNYPENITGASWGGYDNYACFDGVNTIDYSWDPFQTYEFHFEPSTYNINEGVFVTVFIDFNRDHDFYDDGEDIIRWHEHFGSNQNELSGNIIIPDSFEPGWTLMRICYMKSDPSYLFRVPFQTGYMHDGEIEDYAVFLYPQLTCGLIRSSNPDLNYSSLITIPNPANDFITLKGLQLIEGETAQISVINAVGQMELKLITNESSPTLNVEQLSPGVHIINVKTDNRNISNVKFIKY